MQQIFPKASDGGEGASKDWKTLLHDYRSADMFNLLDLPALAWTTVVLVYSYYGDALLGDASETGRPKPEQLMCAVGWADDDEALLLLMGAGSVPR